MLPCRSGTFREAINPGASVRDSGSSAADNEPLAPLLCNPDPERLEEAQRSVSTEPTYLICFEKGGGGGEVKSDYCSVYFYKEHENVGRAQQSDISSTSGREPRRSGENSSF